METINKTMAMLIEYNKMDYNRLRISRRKAHQDQMKHHLYPPNRHLDARLSVTTNFQILVNLDRDLMELSDLLLINKPKRKLQ